MKRKTRKLCGRRLDSMALAVLTVASMAVPGRAGWNPFAPGSPVEIGPQSGQLAVADFNADGHADILASHPLSGRASLLLGDGRGEFPPTKRSVVEFGYDPAAIATGDVNGDDRPDLAVTSRDGSTMHVHILLNHKGEFKEVNDLLLSTRKVNPKSWKPRLVLADVNGDKSLDLIVADGRQNIVDVYDGSPAGAFAQGQTIDVDKDFDLYTLVAGDVNNDGRIDLVVAGAMAEGDDPARLAVLLGNDKGELVRSEELSQEAPAGAQVKAICDVNGDERSDVVLTHGTKTTMLVQSEQGQLAASPGSPFDMGREAFGIAAVHAGFENNDVLVAATANSLDVIYAHEGQTRRACNSPIPAGPGAYQVAVGDINGDGKNDVVANSFEGTSLSLLLSN
jgi:hypothetical protein